MKAICFYFQVHQPLRLKTYRFFDIGRDHMYLDHGTNASIMRKVAEKCYLPANKVLYNLIKKYDEKFKVSFSISGTALEQFEKYAPEVIESFQKLVATGQVELLAETYFHSLVALKSKKEFKAQVNAHMQKTHELFGVYPTVFRNTELIYDDSIADLVTQMGFAGMLTEGAPQLLKERSPNHLYSANTYPPLHLLLKNYKLSDDIAFRFSDQSWAEWPLGAGKFVHWLNDIPEDQEIVNLFMDYETFGEHQWSTHGIFDFLKNLAQQIHTASKYKMVTPSEAISLLTSNGALETDKTISWADEERDLSAWLGNELQQDAFNKLYKLRKKISKCQDNKIIRDWRYLQTSDHFYYMSTKNFADGDVHKYFNPYPSPYIAFINYMNVLSDLEVRLDRHLKAVELSQKHQQLIQKMLHDEKQDASSIEPNL